MKEVLLRRSLQAAAGELRLRETRVVTPWLSADEAALYCGCSRSHFDAFSRRLAHGWSGKLKVYHVETLDQLVRQAGAGGGV